MSNVNKLTTDLSSLINISLQGALKTELEPAVKDLIVFAYDNLLCGIVDSTYTEITPEFYRDTFINRLYDYEFIKVKEGSIVFSCPETYNFNFEGIEFIYAILNGLPGLHYKVSSKYIKGVDDGVVYIVNSSNPILNNVPPTVLEPFEFSSPIDIFSDANEYNDSNINDVISRSTEQAVTTLKAFYAGEHKNG